VSKRIFDPVHRFVELDDGEVALLDTSPMQRLRRLRQLGLAYLAFPGAEHSRFGHALGALAMGDRVLVSLRTSANSLWATDAAFRDDRRLVRAALLLHDIGHGPFSHASEAVLGRAHEARTREILALPAVRSAIENLDVDLREVAALICGDRAPRSLVYKELVSGPNLDADRMDYLLRDAYFTGTSAGRYDAEQFAGSLRVYEHDGHHVLGVDGRGVVALESFVLARYMMFATVYFHHTTRMFERVLQEALREIWPDARALDDIEAFLAWDDFRVLEAFRTAPGAAAQALRERRTRYSVVAEFNAEADLRAYEAARDALRERFGDAVWADEQQQMFHRLPMASDATRQVLVGTASGVVDARSASDLIARISGRAHWRKLFVAKSAPIDEARALCRRVVAETRCEQPGDAREVPPG
jgi:HD superfamily phosphohydrolase